jgi:hypothetical protein
MALGWCKTLVYNVLGIQLGRSSGARNHFPFNSTNRPRLRRWDDDSTGRSSVAPVSAMGRAFSPYDLDTLFALGRWPRLV